MGFIKTELRVGVRLRAQSADFEGRALLRYDVAVGNEQLSLPALGLPRFLPPRSTSPDRQPYYNGQLLPFIKRDAIRLPHG